MCGVASLTTRSNNESEYSPIRQRFSFSSVVHSFLYFVHFIVLGYELTWVRVDRGYEITWVRVDLVQVDLGYKLTVNHSIHNLFTSINGVYINLINGFGTLINGFGTVLLK